jgi:hypothetical protein
MYSTKCKTQGLCSVALSFIPIYSALRSLPDDNSPRRISRLARRQVSAGNAETSAYGVTPALNSLRTNSKGTCVLATQLSPGGSSRCSMAIDKGLEKQAASLNHASPSARRPLISASLATLKLVGPSWSNGFRQAPPANLAFSILDRLLCIGARNGGRARCAPR